MNEEILKELEGFERVWARLRPGQEKEREQRAPEIKLMPQKGKKQRPSRYLPYSP